MAAVIGAEIPLWDSHPEFDDTSMLIDDLAKCDSVARTLGQHVCVLLRGHGTVCVGASLREAAFRSNHPESHHLPAILMAVRAVKEAFACKAGPAASVPWTKDQSRVQQ